MIKRDESEAVKVIIQMNKEGRRGRRKPEIRRLDAIYRDMKMAWVCIDDVRNRVRCRFRTEVADHK